MTTLRPFGVFVGLVALDVIHRIDAPPGPNQKSTANSQFVAAGGPAANAAVTFAALGGQAVLLTALGPELAHAMRDAAPHAALPVVLDAGRWKPMMDELVGVVTDVVASTDFRTPDAATAHGTATELQQRGATTVVATAGPDPVQWWKSGRRGEILVPQIQDADTLGAGDVFHGAYSYVLAAGATSKDGSDSLPRSPRSAARSWGRAAGWEQSLEPPLHNPPHHGADGL